MAEPGFRDRYGPAGPAGYYREHGDDYANPHEPAVAEALAHAVAHWSSAPAGIDFGRVLDLAAGGGEATLVLAGLFPAATIDGIDPYTWGLYERRTGRPCLPVSFEEIARGDHTPAGYSCVVCSCALHLVEDSWLPPLCLALAAAARDLLVVTPLTRPEVRPEWGWRLVEATVCTAEERSVRLRWYRSALLS
jgi:hypothetical protein